METGRKKEREIEKGREEGREFKTGREDKSEVETERQEEREIKIERKEEREIETGVTEERKVKTGVEREKERVVKSEKGFGNIEAKSKLKNKIEAETVKEKEIESDKQEERHIPARVEEDTQVPQRATKEADAESKTDDHCGVNSDHKLSGSPTSQKLALLSEKELGETEPEANSGTAAEMTSKKMVAAERSCVTRGSVNWDGEEMDTLLDKKQASTRSPDEGPGCGTRHTLVIWAFLGFTNLFIQRVGMSITLVAMVSQNSRHPLANVSVEECDGASPAGLSSYHHGKAEFSWSNTLQGFILSAFYYGYFVTQIPSSFLTSRLGGKRMFAFGLGGCSVLALVTPLCARLHPGALIANRILQGCLQGVVFPAMQTLLSVWVPAKERSRLVAVTYAGCQAGTVVGMLGAGYLCDTSLGWTSVFYVEGVLGLLWCVGWSTSIYDSPSLHPRISDEERLYLRRTVDNNSRKSPGVPWKSILTSPALYGIAAAHFANDWGCFAIMTCLPKFMKDILNYDLSSNGLLSSLPYLVMWGANLVAGALADFLCKPNRLKTAHVRKLMVLIGLIGPASLLLASAYYPGCNRTALVVLLTFAMGLSGFTIAGHSVNHLDIAPVFAGLLFAITNSFGTTSGWIGPALVGALTEHHNTRDRWQTFFLVSGAVYATGGSGFVLFARGEVQPWAMMEDSETELIVPSPSYSSSAPAQNNPALEVGPKS